MGFPRCTTLGALGDLDHLGGYLVALIDGADNEVFEGIFFDGGWSLYDDFVRVAAKEYTAAAQSSVTLNGLRCTSRGWIGTEAWAVGVGQGQGLVRTLCAEQ